MDWNRIKGTRFIYAVCLTPGIPITNSLTGMKVMSYSQKLIKVIRGAFKTLS